jgi:lysophospholipase L1-like esterase
MARNVLVTVAAVVVALALCEGFLRLVWGDVLPKSDVYWIDPVIGKRMRPGWSGSEFGAPVQVNSHGLRSPETTYEKPPGTYRILALGDSWTFGFRMTEENSFPRKLERMLNTRLAAREGHPRVEVINSGVVGYSTRQEATYFQVEGKRYSPDLVIVAFYPVNDAEDKSSRYIRYQRLRDIHPWVLEAYTFPRKLYLRQFWKGMRITLKLRLAEMRLWLAEKRDSDDPGAQAILENDWTHRFAEGRKGWRLAKEGMRDIGETSRDLGAHGLVVLLPDVEDLGRYEDRYHPLVASVVRATVEDAGLDWLDLLDVFRPFRGEEDEIRLVGQRHPNAYGYERIAEAIADTVERRYLRLDSPAN